MPRHIRERPKRPSRPTQGYADFDRIDAMTDEEIMRTSPPELANLPDDFWDGARLVYPPGWKGPRVAWPPAKEPISLRVDEDVLAWFRAQGPRYQSRMNAVLRAYMKQMAKRPPRNRKATR